MGPWIELNGELLEEMLGKPVEELLEELLGESLVAS